MLVTWVMPFVIIGFCMSVGCAIGIGAGSFTLERFGGHARGGEMLLFGAIVLVGIGTGLLIGLIWSVRWLLARRPGVVADPQRVDRS